MTKSGLRQCIGNPGVFTGLVTIATHVDDMAGFATTEEALNNIELAIEQHVELERLGTPTKLLGMELTWGQNHEWVKLTQNSAIDNLAKEFGISTTIPTKSLPLNANDYAPLPEKGQPDLELQKKYQSLVGSLLYITRHTRPEISIHVNLLGRRTAQPSQLNLQTGIRVLKYLASSINEGITLKKENQELKNPEQQEVIKGYADASYGGERAVSQSRSLLTMNGQLIM